MAPLALPCPGISMRRDVAVGIKERPLSAFSRVI